MALLFHSLLTGTSFLLLVWSFHTLSPFARTEEMYVWPFILLMNFICIILSMVTANKEGFEEFWKENEVRRKAFRILNFILWSPTILWSCVILYWTTR